MDNPTLGIRIANGTYFPVLGEDDRAKKKVILSPVRENQSDVKIDIFRGEGQAMYNPVYVASLILNNISHDSECVAEVELHIGVSEDGILDAEAFEAKSGVRQFISVSLDTIDDNSAGLFDDDSDDSVNQPRFSADSEEPDFSSYDEDDSEDKDDWPYKDDNKKEKKKCRGIKVIVIILIILLLLLLGALAYIFFCKPSLFEGKAAAPATTTTAPALSGPPATTPPPANRKPVENPVTPPAEEPKTAAPPVVTPRPDPKPEPVKEKTGPSRLTKDVKHRIKWGDTLWDISTTYYRTPWLYPKIAKDNKIKNPDLIYAGNSLTIKAE